MENKFTDSEIMKALGWLERIERDTDVSEWAESIRIILDDYNRQKAEIEKLKEQLDGETVKNMRLGHEVERLNAVSEICGDCHKQYAEKIERAKSEARKELADNIINSVYGFYSSIGIREVIEEIVKKMEGENNVQISH